MTIVCFAPVLAFVLTFSAILKMARTLAGMLRPAFLYVAITVLRPDASPDGTLNQYGC